MVTVRGIGLAAAVRADVIAVTAHLADQQRFHSFWLNNPPGGRAIEQLGSLASDVPELMYGVGVIPLSHTSPEDITETIQAAGLPPDHLYLGIGSGSGPGGLERVRQGMMQLRRLVQCELVIAALGPKMCRLAGEMSDAVLLNWLTPDAARRSLSWIREGALSANRPMPRVMAYVRVAIEGEGSDRFAREAATYASYPHYAAHFDRMGVRAEETGIVSDAVGIERAMATWDGVVDEVVARVITATDTAAEIARVVRAVAL